MTSTRVPGEQNACSLIVLTPFKSGWRSFETYRHKSRTHEMPGSSTSKDDSDHRNGEMNPALAAHQPGHATLTVYAHLPGEAASVELPASKQTVRSRAVWQEFQDQLRLPPAVILDSTDDPGRPRDFQAVISTGAQGARSPDRRPGLRRDRPRRPGRRNRLANSAVTNSRS